MALPILFFDQAIEKIKIEVMKFLHDISQNYIGAWKFESWFIVLKHLTSAL